MAEGVGASSERLVEVAHGNGLYLSPLEAAAFTEEVVKTSVHVHCWRRRAIHNSSKRCVDARLRG
jgi:hypothetical protein